MVTSSVQQTRSCYSICVTLQNIGHPSYRDADFEESIPELSAPSIRAQELQRKIVDRLKVGHENYMMASFLRSNILFVCGTTIVANIKPLLFPRIEILIVVRDPDTFFQY